MESVTADALKGTIIYQQQAHVKDVTLVVLDAGVITIVTSVHQVTS